MDKQAPTDLREQVSHAIFDAATKRDLVVIGRPDFVDVATERVLVVFAEREREQRDETYASGFADGRVAGIKEWDARLRERILARLESEASWVDPVLRADLVGVFDDES